MPSAQGERRRSGGGLPHLHRAPGTGHPLGTRHRALGTLRMTPGTRLDKWLWAARFWKTRSLAAEAIDGGKVEVNGERAKRARHVHEGDEVRVRQPPYEHVVIVRGLSERRGPASEAALLYEERPESVERRAAIRRQLAALPPPAPGRPTKKDRREIRRLKGDG